MRTIPGVADLGLFRVIGQPNLNFDVDREAGRALSASTWPTCRTRSRPRSAARRSARCCRASSATTWWCATSRAYRDTKEAIENIRLVSPSGERVSLAQLCNVKVLDGASEIYREGNSRYVAIKYSVRGRDLGSTVEEAIAQGGASR